MKEYLEETDLIDISNIKKYAEKLTSSASDSAERAKILFEFVRDEIAHSSDVNKIKITKFASEVYMEGHGLCYSKSILLVAMLRATGIPAGFGYQKLILDDEAENPVFVLHGYVFLYLEKMEKWIKVDPRGNTKGINAQFSTELPELAYPVRSQLGEVDEDRNHSYPIRVIEDYLKRNGRRDASDAMLPGDFSDMQG